MLCYVMLCYVCYVMLCYVKTFNEARGKAVQYISAKRNAKLFVNGKFIPASPLTGFVYVRAPLSTHFQR